MSVLSRIGVLLFLGLLPALAFCDTTHERLVTISITIFPKIVALDLDLANKLDADGDIRLGLIYSGLEDNAGEIAADIKRQVSQIAGKTVEVDIVAVSSLGPGLGTTYAGFFITEPFTENDLAKSVQYAKHTRTLLFSPFEADIKRGVTASIFVGARIQPYFNLNALEQSGVNLKPAILKVSKTYE